MREAQWVKRKLLDLEGKIDYLFSYKLATLKS